MEIDTVELERLAASITPGPWVIGEDEEHGLPTECLFAGGFDVATLWGGYNAAAANARAIALVHDLLAEVIAMRAEAARLVEALTEAAVPLVGLTLAANMSESNMGLCKGTWDEINNAVSHIRDALSAHTQRVTASKGSDQ